MTSILATQNFFENWDDFYVGIPCGSKNSSKINLSHTVIEIEAFLCFAILGKKIENSSWPPFLGRQKFFGKLGWLLCRYPADHSKISLKLLYLAQFLRYMHFCALQFLQKFESSKWPPFLVRQIFRGNRDGYSEEIPCG